MKRLAFSLLLLSFCMPLFASVIDMSLDPADWIKNHSESYTAALSQNADGSLRVTCNTYRGWIWYRSEKTYNLQGTTVRYKWRMHCANNYAWGQDGLYPWSKMAPQNLTTHHSWASSIVISTNTWIYTEVHFNPDRTWTSDYSYNDYQGQPGSIRITGNSGTISEANWDLLASSYLNKYMGDGYASSFYFEIAEAYYMTPGPEIDIVRPATEPAYYEPNEPIHFEASASGGAEPYRFQWESDVQGILGDANSITVDSLLMGPHTITVTCIDDANEVSTKTTQVYILQSPVIEPIDSHTITDAGSYTGPIPHLTQGDSLAAWSLVDPPSGMTIDELTGQVFWPSPASEGSPYTITLRIENPVGLDEVSYQLEVIETPSFVSTIWSDVFDGQGTQTGHDIFSDCKFDHDGNIIAIGYSDTDPTYQNDGYTRKYSSGGTLLWEKKVAGPYEGGSQVEFRDGFADVAVDSLNNIFVVGTRSNNYYNGSNFHNLWWIQKYTPDGQTLLKEVLWGDTSASAWQSAAGIFIDADDNVYVTGNSFGGWGSLPQYQWITFKYDNNLNVLLGPLRVNVVNDFDVNESANDVVVDANGDIYVCGYVAVVGSISDRTYVNRDWCVIKYNGTTGAIIWQDIYAGPSSRHDGANSMRLDSEGNLVTVGVINKGSDNTTNADYDWLMIKYDSTDGGRLWTTIYEHGTKNDSCTDLVIDDEGNIYTTGYVTAENSTYDGLLLKIDGRTGNIIGRQIWSSDTHSYYNGIDRMGSTLVCAGTLYNAANADTLITLMTVDLAVQISEPISNSFHLGGQPITLAAELVGTAEPPYYFSWSSDIDGPLGTGQNLQAAGLSLGDHLIVCRMDYGDNESTESTVRIHVVTVPKIAPMEDITIPDGQVYTGPIPVISPEAGVVEWSLIDGPAGMTIDAASGVVAWTDPIANPIGYDITVEASNAVGSDQITYTLFVLESPVVEQADNQIILYGASYTSAEPILLSGTPPVTWELLMGPAGMEINPNTGQLIWSSANNEGANTIRIRVINAAASDEMQFTLTVMRPPLLASLTDANAKLHTAYSRNVSLLQGTGPVAWQFNDPPAEMTVSNGTIQWPDPQPKDSSHIISITATNAVGSDTKTYNLTVLESPVVESIDDLSVYEGTSMDVQVSLSEGSLPVQWKLLSAPAGVSINSQTGAVAWPTVVGHNSPYTITVQAQNAVGTSQDSFVVTVIRPPIIIGIANAAAAENSTYTSVTPGLYQGTAPITWSLVTGPAGMTVDSATGIVTWPTVVYRETTYPVEIRAENVVSSDTESWLLRVIQSPVIGVINDVQTADNAAFYGPVPVLNQGTEVTWSLVSAPAGMTINAATGQVRWNSPVDSGIPETVTIQASNIAGSAQQTFEVDVWASPVIRSIAQQTAQEYSPYTGPVPTLVKGDGAIIWSLVNGPAGMMIDSVTGQVSWDSPIAAGNPYIITIKAANNVGYDVSTWQLAVPIGYDADVDADVISAPAGTPVTLSGSVNWLYQPAPQTEVPVEIDVRVQGTTRTLRTTTDGTGQFSTAFHPLPHEAGLYEVAAVHPLAVAADAQDGFQLYAIRVEPDKAYHTLKPGQVIEGQLTLINPGDLPLSGISYEITGIANNLELTVDMPTELDGLAEGTVHYSLTATDSSVQNDVFDLDITTAEGAAAQVRFNIKVVPLAYDVRVYPESLKAGMVRGQNRLIQFEVYNVGGAPSESLEVLVPQADWLTLSSPSTIGVIEPNDVELVSLQLMPGDTLPLGSYSGEVIVYGGGIVKHIPFEFICVSDAVGDTQITVVDEFTYYAEGSPNVEGARITLIDSITGDLAGTATTDATGVVMFENLPEAHYEVIIDEADHGSYRNVHYVMPGVVNRITAFMPRNLVRYEWTVIETEIEDHYELVLETVFETTVPAPVITIEPAKIDLAMMEGDEMHVDFVITNHGLVSADNAFIRFDHNDQYEVELLSDYFGEIMPQQTIVVPAVIRDTYYVEPAAAGNGEAMLMDAPLATAGSSDCNNNFKGKVYYRLVCGDDGKWKTVPVHVGFWTCPKDTPPTRPTNPPGEPGKPLPPSPEDDEEESGGGGSGKTPVSRPNNGGGGGGGGGGGSSPNAPYITYGMVAGDIVGTQCDPCPGKQFEAFTSCAISFLPLNCPMTVLKSAWDIASACTSNDVFSFNCLNTVVGGILGSAGNCLKDAGGLSPIGLAYNILNCLYGIATACDSQDAAAFAAGVAQLETLTGQEFSHLTMDDETTQLLYQQAQQLEKMMDGLTVLFGDSIWFSGIDTDGAVFEDLMNAVNLSTDEVGPVGQRISDLERAELLVLPLPSQMDTSHINAFCDRWNRSLDYWEQGKFTTADLEPGDNPDFIDAAVLQQKSAVASQAAQAALDQGFESLFDGAYYAQQEFYASVTQGSEGVCAKVKVQIKQDAVMTRTAFNVSLELDNESDKWIDNVLVDVQITDEAGTDVTDLFGIYPPSLSGISAINGTTSLPAGGQARAEWIILPTNEAAPDAEKVFYVGATLTYDIDGLEVRVPIYPDQITVKPEAQLSIQYFHQKDVYSDDPFTEAIEPAEPYSLGMMVTNSGAGVARNVQITSAQPQIVRHEQDKDILIDFEIIDAELNGHDLTDSLTVNMGDIAPGGVTIARWQMISSLQGRFTSYNASFEHINGLGDPRLSLIQQVDVHELIHAVRLDTPSDDGIVDFLVNDLADANTLPETLYTSTGSIEPVSMILTAQADGAASEEDLQVQIIAPVSAGHVYIQLDNPAEEGLVLASVIRSDGKVLLPEYNAWTSDRLMRALDEPHYRQRLLHLFDTDSTGDYTVTYTTIQYPLEIDDLTCKSDPVATVDITFDNPVDPATFDWTDIELTRDFGANLITYPITIRPLSATTFRLSGLAYLTAPAGRYELRIKTGGVQGVDGLGGASVYSAIWHRTLAPWNIVPDSIVDFQDFAILAQKWTQTGCKAPLWCQGADINRDGSVNMQDVLIQCQYWLEIMD